MTYKELLNEFDPLIPPPVEDTSRISQRDVISTGIPERLLRAVFTREVWLQGHPQWTDSWTVNSTYTDVPGAVSSLNFDDFSDHEFRFEMIGKTDAGTGYYRLYNTTTGAAVLGSEVSTTSTAAVRVRSGSIPKPAGTNVLKIQHKITGGNGSDEYVDSIMSRLVFRLP